MFKETQEKGVRSLEPDAGDRNDRQSVLLLVGASHKSSPLGFREDLRRRFNKDAVESLPGVKEWVVLSTCNRLEVYFVTEDPEAASEAFLDFARGSSVHFEQQYIYTVRGPEVVRHLFRVASGLDSVAVGEPEIMSQVRRAGVEGRVSGKARGIMSPLFDRAYRVGKRAHDSKGLGSEAESLGARAATAAIDRAKRKTDVLLLGTGRMIQVAGKRIHSRAERVYVATERQSLPISLRGFLKVSYDDVPRIAGKCGVIVSATNHEGFVLGPRTLKGRKRVVVDLGMPRNVDPAVRNLPNVTLLDLDDIAREAAKEPPDRERLRAAETAAWKEAAEFYNWLVESRLSTAVSELYGWANGVRDEELNRALRKLESASTRDRRTVEAMARRIVSKLMSKPTLFARSRYRNLSEEDKLRLLEVMFGIGRDRQP